MKTLRDLLDMYSRATTQRERAELEAAIREAAPAHLPRTPQKHVMQWQSETLGVTQYDLAMRRDLWCGGGPAEVLWPRIEDGLQMRAAVKLLRKARGTVNRHDREGLRLAIERELKLFDDQDRARYAEPEDPDDDGPPLPRADLEPKEFHHRLRKSLLAYMQPRLGSLPEHDREKLVDDFERDIKALIAQHGAKWQKLARVLTEQKRVSRQKFVNALRTLHMDPPRRGSPLEPLVAQANKQKRTLARLYHPDSHGGSEHTRAQYQAVLDAFLIIEQYVSENPSVSRAPALRVVDGGKK